MSGPARLESPFANVVVGVDGAPGSLDAVALARRLMGRDGCLTLAHVHLGAVPLVPDRLMWDEESAQRSLHMLHAVRDDVAPGAEVVSLAAQSPGEGLHRVAEQRGADLLVVGSCARSPLGRVHHPVGAGTRPARRRRDRDRRWPVPSLAHRPLAAGPRTRRPLRRRRPGGAMDVGDVATRST